RMECHACFKHSPRMCPSTRAARQTIDCWKAEVVWFRLSDTERHAHAWRCTDGAMRLSNVTLRVSSSGSRSPVQSVICPAQLGGQASPVSEISVARTSAPMVQPQRRTTVRSRLTVAIAVELQYKAAQYGSYHSGLLHRRRIT